MIIITEYQYFPTVSLLSALIKIKHINFESYETYQKGGFRNRSEVLGSNGVIQLVIPLVGGRTQKLQITDVKIDFREDWQRSHFRTLLACYNRSAFFEYYRDGLDRLFQRRLNWLVEWNMSCLEWVISVLKFDMVIGKTTSFEPGYSSEEYADFRGILNPKNRMLPGVKPIYYPQVFSSQGGFVPGISILDLIFCEGPRAGEILKKMLTEE